MGPRRVRLWSRASARLCTGSRRGAGKGLRESLKGNIPMTKHRSDKPLTDRRDH
jgi:hypothetical protein